MSADLIGTLAKPKRVRKPAAPPEPVSFAPEVLDIAGAATLLRVSRSSLYKLAAEGKIPGQKVGGQWRFSRATLLRWLGGDRPRLSRSTT